MSEWARPGELDVFATGETTIVSDRDSTAGATTELLHRAGSAMAAVHARPGYRPGLRISTTSARRGGDTDIVRSVLVSPRRACRVAIDGALFEHHIDGFEFDQTTGSDADFLVWHARLSGEHVDRIPVSLHLLAAPSMVVTVLELVPQRAMRWQRNGFVVDAVRVVEAIAARLTVLCTASAAA